MIKSIKTKIIKSLKTKSIKGTYICILVYLVFKNGPKSTYGKMQGFQDWDQILPRIVFVFARS